MEQAPPQESLETPNVELTTKYGRVDLNWLNACLIRTDYPLTNNYLEYTTSNNQELPVMLTDKEWDIFETLEYPWIYTPDISEDREEDKIYVSNGKQRFWFTRTNTGMRLFKDSKYNHVDHTDDGKEIKIAIHEELWKTLFENDFAMNWMPFVDPQSKEWFEGRRDSSQLSNK